MIVFNFYHLQYLFDLLDNLTLRTRVSRPGWVYVVAAGSWQWPPEVGSGNTRATGHHHNRAEPASNM